MRTPVRLSDGFPVSGGWIVSSSTSLSTKPDYLVTQSDAYATRLAESLTSRSCRVVGASSVVAFRAGARIAVHGKDDYDEHLVLNQVTHSLANGAYSKRSNMEVLSSRPHPQRRCEGSPSLQDTTRPALRLSNPCGIDGEDSIFLRGLSCWPDKSQEVIQMTADEWDGTHRIIISITAPSGGIAEARLVVEHRPQHVTSASADAQVDNSWVEITSCQMIFFNVCLDDMFTRL